MYGVSWLGLIAPEQIEQNEAGEEHHRAGQEAEGSVFSQQPVDIVANDVVGDVDELAPGSSSPRKER